MFENGWKSPSWRHVIFLLKIPSMRWGRAGAQWCPMDLTFSGCCLHRECHCTVLYTWELFTFGCIFTKCVLHYEVLFKNSLSSSNNLPSFKSLKVVHFLQPILLIYFYDQSITQSVIQSRSSGSWYCSVPFSSSTFQIIISHQSYSNYILILSLHIFACPALYSQDDLSSK
jgi:hypothetical protein